ncbi:nmrA-like family domain-containing protein 1 isoform X2 [Branchiostoma floridae]|uniref:NmrA-like family domain-containing protein 1 n=2 Tax=Branchiostoma floridae TaxID=7739 RepID=A0A9J7LJM6_BRAFL|nr:nmrA-like family domain-containing protein 1 isoform X1 [Branchiostoma floridae]XP_035683388.1 nmrA-like family domain-containing protein 1 isoform X2 [Branchiostoma floridae]
MAKLITVFGATGTQGGAVANALLEDQDFKVRAVTRNASSDKAKALQAKGAEVVTASLDDPSTLGPALQDAHGVFVLTNYWEHMDQEREIKQGKAIADAAKAAGVLHVVFSGLENVQKIAGFPCPHFDAKGQIEEYMTSIELPVTFVRYSSFYENYISSLKPQKQKDGTYVLGVPMEGAAMDIVSAADMGPAVRTIFKNRAQWIRKAVGFSGDRITIQQTADILSKHLAPKVFKASDMTAEAFAQLRFPGADDLGNMFKFYRLHNPDRSVELTRQLHPAAKSFDTWVAENKEVLQKSLD